MPILPRDFKFFFNLKVKSHLLHFYTFDLSSQFPASIPSSASLPVTYSLH